MADTTIGRGIIEVAVDGKKVRAGIDQAKQSLNSLGITAQNVTKQSSASIDKYVRSLGVAALTAGKTAREAELLKLGLRGATDAQIAAADAALRMTEAHEKSIQRLDRLRTITLSAAAAGTALAVGFGYTIAASIEALDKLNDLSKATGITVEDLSGLGFLARTSGTDINGLADSINKLSKNIGKDPEKFRALGVTAKDPLKAFQQLADVFAKIEDPQLRAALGAEALGKSWASAAPALSEGGQRIGEIVEKGKILSGATSDLAQRADELKDKFEELKLTSQGLVTRLAGEMIPAFTEITKAITQAYQESGKLEAAWVALGSVGAFLFTDEFSSAQVKIQNLRMDIASFERNIKELQSTGGGLLNRLIFGTKEENEKKIAEAKKQIEAIQKSLEPKLKPPKPAGDPQAEAAAAAFVGLNDSIKTIQTILAARQDMTEKSISLDRAETQARLASISDLLKGREDLQRFELDSIRWRARAAQDAFEKENALLQERAKVGKTTAEEQLAANRKLYDNLIARSIDYFNVYKTQQEKILTLDRQIAESRKQVSELLRGIEEKGLTPEQKIDAAQRRAVEADTRLQNAVFVGNIKDKEAAVQELITAIKELDSLGQTGLARQFINSLSDANESSFFREKLSAQSIASAAQAGVQAIGKQLDEVEKRIAGMQDKLLLDIKVAPNNESLKNLISSIKDAISKESFQINVSANPNSLNTMLRQLDEAQRGL